MQKQIGKVKLDDTFYTGSDFYTDGSIEDDLLDAVKEGRQDEVLAAGSQWPVLYHLSDIRENLLEWYPFSRDASVLEIGSGCGALTGLLSRKVKEVTCIELSEKRSMINAYRNRECGNVKIMIGNFQSIEPALKEQYDYITLIGVWEYAGLYVDGENPYLEMLEIAKKHLKKDGKIIIAIENKMGIKYWNGAPEDHTNLFYEGLNDYINSKTVRTFSKQEMEKLLKDAFVSQYTFYYPMPDYKLPEVIYTDSFLPNPGKERNYGKEYDACRIYNFNDAVVSDQICADHMFTYFANSFLVVTGDEEERIKFGKYNRCRKDEFRIKTEIFDHNGCTYIKKAALTECAKGHVLRLKENERKWKGSLPNLRYVEGYLENDGYITPYIQGTDLETLFYEYRNRADLFMEKFSYYAETYLKADEEALVPFAVSDGFRKVFGDRYPSNQKSLKYTNVDLTFSNLKLTPDNELYSFDYEWVFDFLIPYEFVIWYSANQLYEKYRAYLKNRISKEAFLTGVGITKENIPIYENMDWKFGRYVLGKNGEKNYLLNYRKNAVIQNIKFL